MFQAVVAIGIIIMSLAAVWSISKAISCPSQSSERGNPIFACLLSSNCFRLLPDVPVAVGLKIWSLALVKRNESMLSFLFTSANDQIFNPTATGTSGKSRKQLEERRQANMGFPLSLDCEGQEIAFEIDHTAASDIMIIPMATTA